MPGLPLCWRGNEGEAIIEKPPVRNPEKLNKKVQTKLWCRTSRTNACEEPNSVQLKTKDKYG